MAKNRIGSVNISMTNDKDGSYGVVNIHRENSHASHWYHSTHRKWRKATLVQWLERWHRMQIAFLEREDG